MRIVSVGESTYDYYPAQNASFVGGISLNFAVRAKRAGADHVSLVSRVGSDLAANFIFDKLAQEGVDATRVLALPGRTAHCEIVVRENGERYFPPNSYHQGALTGFRPNADDLAHIRQHDILVSLYDQSRSNAMFDDLIAAPFRGRRVADFGDWFDYSTGGHAVIPPYLAHIDVAFVSGDEPAIDYLWPFVRTTNCLFVVTLGANGSIALFGERRIYQPAIPVANIVDTTGCGDAFQGTFTVVYFRTGDVKAALHAGSVAASSATQHFGAT